MTDRATARTVRAFSKESTKIRALLQAIAKDNGPIVEPVLKQLERGASMVKGQIEFNIVSAGLVDQSDLVDSVAAKKFSNGFRWKVGFFKKGNRRLWRKAGWRAHFAEWGTETQPGHHSVGRAGRDTLPAIINNVERAVDTQLRRFASDQR